MILLELEPGVELAPAEPHPDTNDPTNKVPVKSAINLFLLKIFIPPIHYVKFLILLIFAFNFIKIIIRYFFIFYLSSFYLYTLYSIDTVLSLY